MALSTDPWDATELVAYINEVCPGMVDEAFFAKCGIAGISYGHGIGLLNVKQWWICTPFTLLTRNLLSILM